METEKILKKKPKIDFSVTCNRCNTEMKCVGVDISEIDKRIGFLYRCGKCDTEITIWRDK